jgi:hypothetical protein
MSTAVGSGIGAQVALALLAPWMWLQNSAQSQRQRWALWLYAALAAAWVAVPAVALLAGATGSIAGVLLAVVGASGLLAWWGFQFSALLRLDHPHAARFVVRHGLALRTAAVVLWLALVLLVGVVALPSLALPGGNPTRAVLLVLLGAGATLLFIALALRWWPLWVVLWVFFPVLGFERLRFASHQITAKVYEHWQTMPVLYTALALLAMAVALVHLFGNADTAHARAYAKRETYRKIASAGAAGNKPAWSAYGRWGELLSTPAQRMADAWLARITHRASPTPSSVMARAEVVLNGAQHWSRHVATHLAVQLGLGAGFYAVLLLASDATRQSIFSTGVGLSIGLASITIAPLISLPSALWASRREQALLVLLPGMPQGTALNRVVARLHMRHFGWAWASALPVVAALAWWAKAPQWLAFVGAALPLAAWLWRDASRVREPGPAKAVVPYLLFVVLGTACMQLLQWQPTWLLPWALGTVLLSAALLAWRWRQLARWPQALPAGRLG